ncbi:MAG: C-terminal binding protein [Chloroflexota bacterium]
MKKVLVTDYAWPSLEIEKDIIGAAGGELVVAENGESNELMELAKAHSIAAIMTNWKIVSGELLEACPECKVITRFGVGIDNIAVAKATELGIPVTNVPDYCMEETADHAMAFILAFARNLPPLISDTAQNGWNLHLTGRPFRRMKEQTLGIIGFGNIAQALVPKALGFGMRVIAHTPRLTADRVPAGVEATQDLGYLLSEADFVSVHVPAMPQTEHLINAKTLELMKPSAYLINTARGAIVDEQALYEALKEKVIAGAALDVLKVEAPNSKNPLFELENCWVTPHAAFYSPSAIAELEEKAATAVAAALSGDLPRNIVNPDVSRQSNYRLSKLS